MEGVDLMHRLLEIYRSVRVVKKILAIFLSISSVLKDSLHERFTVGFGIKK